MFCTMAQTKENKLCLKNYTHTEQQVFVQPAATVSGQPGTEGRLGEDEDTDPSPNKHTYIVCRGVYMRVFVYLGTHTC